MNKYIRDLSYEFCLLITGFDKKSSFGINGGKKTKYSNIYIICLFSFLTILIGLKYYIYLYLRICLFKYKNLFFHFLFHFSPGR